MTSTRIPFHDADFDELDTSHVGAPSADDRNWGLIAHLSVFAGLAIPFGNVAAPLVVLATKGKESAFVAEAARSALNFQLTALVAAVVFGVLSVVLVGIPFLIALGVAWFVLPVLAVVKASEGEAYRYPLTPRLVK